MKVAALSPKFVNEAPPSEKTGAAGGDARGSGEQGTNEETRSGLKRLAEFIQRQRRAPEEVPPEAPSPELTEKRVDEASHEFTKIMLAWQARPRVINSMAQVISDELKRRRGLAAYQKMQAIKRRRPADLVAIATEVGVDSGEIPLLTGSVDDSLDASSDGLDELVSFEELSELPPAVNS